MPPRPVRYLPSGCPQAVDKPVYCSLPFISATSTPLRGPFRCPDLRLSPVHHPVDKVRIGAGQPVDEQCAQGPSGGDSAGPSTGARRRPPICPEGMHSLTRRCPTCSHQQGPRPGRRLSTVSTGPMTTTNPLTLARSLRTSLGSDRSDRGCFPWAPCPPGCTRRWGMIDRDVAQLSSHIHVPTAEGPPS